MPPHDHEGDKKITTPEEARAWVDREWKKGSKHDWYRTWYRKQIKINCEIVGRVSAFIVMLLFGRQLPAWLFEGARGSNLLLEAGTLLGAGVGLLISWLVVRRMKRKEEEKQED